MPGRKRGAVGYSDHFKGQVLGDYAAGSSNFAIAQKYGVTTATIDRWANQAGIKRGTRTSENAREELGDLVLRYANANLHAMIAIAEHVTDKEWLKQQSAEGLALITSTLHDKTIHILSSMQANADAEKQLAALTVDQEGAPAGDDVIDIAEAEIEITDGGYEDEGT